MPQQNDGSDVRVYEPKYWFPQNSTTKNFIEKVEGLKT